MNRKALRLIFVMVLGGLASCGSGTGDKDAGRDEQSSEVQPTDATACDQGDAERDAEDPADLIPPEQRRLTQYVDPFIGSAGSGNVIPGPMLPHGMVKLSPDTLEDSGSIDAYDWGTNRIEGFSHTHLEGPGGSENGYSEVLFLPVAGPLNTNLEQVASAYSHNNEEASPGYYRVYLEHPRVDVELTATHRAGFHRYHLPAGFLGHMLLDLGHTRGVSLNGHAEVTGTDTIEGYGTYNMHAVLLGIFKLLGEKGGERTVYFSARFSSPLGQVLMANKTSEPQVAASLDGPNLVVAVPITSPSETNLEIQVGISYVSVEQARINRETEIGDLTFEEVRSNADAAWNEVLNRIQVDGTNEQDKTRFYTALYHSLMQPVDFTEGSKFWIGFSGEGKVKDADGFHYYSDDWCIWDTVRTTHPLQLLVEPEREADKLQSAVEAYKDGGWIPKCPWQATGYSRVMIANHSICVLADAAAKGHQALEPELAFAGALKLAEDDIVPELLEGLYGYLNYGTLPSYRNKGYVPFEDDETQAVSMTLEYAYNDWCLARLADTQGDRVAVARFDARSQSYKNHWDAETGFMRPKMADGSWLTPFDPASSPGYCEANAWIYTWFVPHDPSGLIELFGGSDQFISKLDQFFDENRFDPTNEPDFHTPFMYNYAGMPWKTQQRCDNSMASTFTTQPDGLPGNDDAGATSAWFVFYAMGIYPFAPGEAKYTITTPLFDRIAIYPDRARPGRAFVVEAPGASEGKRYITAASLDDEPLDVPWLDHGAVMRGARLRFEVADEHSDWGSNP